MRAMLVSKVKLVRSHSTQALLHSCSGSRRRAQRGIVAAPHMVRKVFALRYMLGAGAIQPLCGRRGAG
jgi:hypothetical protein